VAEGTVIIDRSKDQNQRQEEIKREQGEN